MAPKSFIRRIVALCVAVASTAVGSLVLTASSGAAVDLVNTVPPTITGTAVQGSTLTVTPGTWTGTAPITLSYVWSDGTTGTTDPLSAADVGKQVTVTETATDSTGSASMTSTAVGPVTAPPVNSVAPTIAGTPVVGANLTANKGTWSGTDPITYTYQWSDGSTAATKTVTASDVGLSISVTVTAHNVAGTASATSPAIGPVVAAPLNTALPTISGTAQQGQTLIASPGSWSGTGPINFSYQWSDGTSGPRDTLSAADVGHRVTVTVTATNSGGTASATSGSLGPVAPPASISVGTSTTLQASPSSASTNEGVLLIATVTSSNGGVPPSGSIAFKNGAANIGGCANVVVMPTGQSVTVTCRTSFGAANASLTAVFTPAPGSKLTPSGSPPDSFAIGRDSTSTALDVSTTTDVGASTTYTATVNPPAARPGPILPSGSVEFLDGGQPIPACADQPVRNGGATCTVTYHAAGGHSISADYLGDANFTGSLSPAEAVNVVAPPANAPRAITSTMQWTFYYSPSYTKVLALFINGAAGDRVVVSCRGHGCPFAKRSARVGKSRRCSSRRRACQTARGTMNLTPQFRNKLLKVGARIAIALTRPGWVGKYYSFTVRAGRGPRVRIRCLAPGRSTPGRRC